MLITPEFFASKTKEQRLKTLSLAKSLALSQRDANQTMELLGRTIKALLANKEEQIDAQLMHTEIIATFNTDETLKKYLEALLQVIEINENTVISVIYILNVSLEALQKQGKSIKIKGFREKTVLLLTYIFKPDHSLLEDPQSEEQIITFFKNLAQLGEESSYIGEDLAPRFEELIRSSKIKEFNYWLYALIKIFKGHPASITLLYQLAHSILTISHNDVDISADEQATDPLLIIREFFLNLFTVQREPWYYTNKGPVLSAESMIPILTEILRIFPTSLYDNQDNRTTFSVVRMHIGRGYQYLQRKPQYLDFLANEYVARLLSQDIQFLQPIKQELASLSLEDLHDFFRTHGETLWKYIHGSDVSKPFPSSLTKLDMSILRREFIEYT